MDSKVLEEYLGSLVIEKGASANTIKAYYYDINNFLNFAMRSKNFSSDVGKKYIEYIIDIRQLAPRTVRRRAIAIAGFLSWCRSNNPQIVITPPKPPSSRPFRSSLPKTVRRVELRTLLSIAYKRGPTDTIYIALLLMLSTGIRVGELCQLRVLDFEQENKRIRVFGKGRKERFVYISDHELTEGLETAVAERRDNAPLFLNMRGTALKPQSIRNSIRQLCCQAGIDTHVTPHMLRHTSATMHLERGVDIRFVQKMLGHSSIATTQIYTHVSDRALKAAMEKGDPLAEFRDV